jgi:sugar lactone lactonase YvrE
VRYVGAMGWLFATVVLLLAVGTAAGQVGDNVLVQGSPYGALSGVYFDDLGRLHVARRTWWHHPILIMDPESGSLIDELRWGNCTESDLCVNLDDLTIGPDGSFYWIGSMYHAYDYETLGAGVGRQTPEGVTTVQLVYPQASEWLPRRDHPIAFSEDGRLFVVTGSSGDRLYEVDPELGEPPRLVIETLGWMKGFDFGPDGFLYGPIWTEDRKRTAP